MFDKHYTEIIKSSKKLNQLELPSISWRHYDQSNLEVNVFNKLQQNWINKEDYYNYIANKSVIVTDSNLIILFVSEELSKLTGYHLSEIIGKSPKIFQGNSTSETTKNKIKKAISKRHPFKESLVNYKKDGTKYRCEIEAYPKFDKENNLIHFIAFKRKTSKS